MIARGYDGTLDGLFDIVWEMSQRVKKLEDKVDSIETELMTDDEITEQIMEEYITL